jgi:hypothetical protein
MPVIKARFMFSPRARSARLHPLVDTIRPLHCLEASLARATPIRQVRGSRETVYCRRGIGATTDEDC